MKRTLFIATLLALTSQVSLAEPGEPTPQEPVLPPQPSLEKKIVLEGDWRETGHAKLIFVGEEESSKVGSVQLEAKVTGQTWFAALECEGDETLSPGALTFRAQKALFNSARGFAAWKIDDGEQALSTGLETSVFGRDKLRLERETSLTSTEQPLTELQYETPLPFQTKVGLRGSRQGMKNEIEGLLRQESGLGWEWGAGVKAQVNSSEQGASVLSRPEVQGNLRWTW